MNIVVGGNLERNIVVGGNLEMNIVVGGNLERNIVVGGNLEMNIVVGGNLERNIVTELQEMLHRKLAYVSIFKYALENRALPDHNIIIMADMRPAMHHQ